MTLFINNLYRKKFLTFLIIVVAGHSFYAEAQVDDNKKVRKLLSCSNDTAQLVAVQNDRENHRLIQLKVSDEGITNYFRDKRYNTIGLLDDLESTRDSFTISSKPGDRLSFDQFLPDSMSNLDFMSKYKGSQMRLYGGFQVSIYPENNGLKIRFQNTIVSRKCVDKGNNTSIGSFCRKYEERVVSDHEIANWFFDSCYVPNEN